MYRKLRAAFGEGGPSVDTVLDTAVACPGETVSGSVRIQGGADDVVIDQALVALVTQAERVSRHTLSHRYQWGEELCRVVVGQDQRVPAGRPLDLPFTLTLPWETPITAVGDAVLPVMVGVRTELRVRDAHDTSDLDQLLVQPLPSQNRVLDAFGQLSAGFREVEVTLGRVAEGVAQELGFSVWLRFASPVAYAERIKEVGLTFIASQRDLCVVLGADRRGLLGDVFGNYTMTHEEAGAADWASLIGGWLAEVARKN